MVHILRNGRWQNMPCYICRALYLSMDENGLVFVVLDASQELVALFLTKGTTATKRIGGIGIG